MDLLRSPGEPLAVRSVGTALGEDGVTYPTALIDASGRPDVADLARVHAIEGVGDITTDARVVGTPSGGTALLLGVALTKPVHCRFAVRFELPEHRVVLNDAATTDTIVLATEPPAGGGVNPVWLALDLDGTALRRVLDRAPGRP
jgi:hypothetical protein